MKKLRVTVDGVTYDVEVEILEDDEDTKIYFCCLKVLSPS